jgi:MFS family permease
VASLTYGQLLKGNRNFRNLLAGQVISELGNWFNFIAALGLLRHVSGASPRVAGIFFLCRLLPFAIVSPIAGTLADRFSRRQIMIWTDLARVGAALMFLFVTKPEDLWIAYLGTVLLTTFGAFFEGAKNATTPNIVGKDGLLSGTALMFSTRFLLMFIGSALGGWAAAFLGYEIAFIINAISFAVSAYTVWLIPEEATRDQKTAELRADKATRPSFFAEMREGLHYATTNYFALTIILMNMIWAVGGGAINVIFERVGGVHFVDREGWNPDIAVAILWTAAGGGLGLGMLIAHRTSVHLDRKGRHAWFIGISLILHGVLFALAGFMPTLFLFVVFTFVSRFIIGVEYAIQETLFQRSLPDYIRGRISTVERGAELTVYGIVSYFTAELMYYMTPMTLTVASGLLSGAAGVLWFIRQGTTNEKITEAEN